MSNTESDKLVQDPEAMDSNEESAEETSSPDGSPGKMHKMRNDASDASNTLDGLVDQINQFTFDPESFVKSLPAPVRRRLKAMKKLQMERVKVEAKFYEEIHNLEAKYAEKFQPLDEKRANIINGELEPTDSDCDWVSDEEEEADPESNEAGGDTKSPNAVNTPDIKGMPEFWLTVLKHSGDIAEVIQEHDEPVLKCLMDIKTILAPPGDPISFTLEFHFATNDYFTNTVLTKKYIMKLEPDDKDIMFEGPEIAQSVGCEIDWKAGKNVTVKTIKKKQKHKKSGVQRTVTKQVQADSFFNFFSPPPLEEQKEPPTEEMEAQLQSDFEMGHFFREQIIPRAVLYYTGDAIEDESDDDEDYDEDDDEDDDDDEAPAGAYPGHNFKGRGRGHPNGQAAGDGKNAECKQQ